MTDDINILFLGGAKRVSFAEHLKSAGERIGKHVHIFSYELDVCVPIASVGKVIVGRKWRDVDVIEHLQNVISENKINIVLPFVDPAISVLAKLKQANNTLFAPISDMAVCQTMFDKVESAKWFEAHNIPIPNTYKKEQSSFPLIMKPRTGSASKGIMVVNSAEELAAIPFHEMYLIQQYIPVADEYTIDCYVAQDGSIISTVPRLRIETAGGEAVRTRTLRSTALMGIAHKVLGAGSFRGPVTIQVLHDKSADRYLVMEINPRAGGGIICSIAAGADVTSYILQEYMGIALKPCIDWRDGTLMTRYFKEVIF